MICTYEEAVYAATHLIAIRWLLYAPRWSSIGGMKSTRSFLTYSRLYVLYFPRGINDSMSSAQPILSSRTFLIYHVITYPRYSTAVYAAARFRHRNSNNLWECNLLKQRQSTDVHFVRFISTDIMFHYTLFSIYLI